MSRFIETIKLLDGKYQHPDMHLQRIQDSCMQYYGKHREMMDLKSNLNPREKDGVYKVTVSYDFDNFTMVAIPYHIRSINNLVLIEDNDIDYSLKYADRTLLEKYKEQAGIDNECIIVKNNRITDTSFSNIALWNGVEWHTPLYPLLHGIKRKYLLQNRKIVEKDILAADLSDYSKVSLINSMLELGESEIDIGRIMFLSDL